MNPIVLLTDFGLKGPYVGQMKGVLTGLAPQSAIIDLCHTVQPQNIREGAFLLETSWAYFPVGSVFIAVVDPGVGTQRAAVAMETEDRFFVGPDNGILLGALSPQSRWRAVRLDSPGHRMDEISQTFHGRDLFAPAGAALAAGSPLRTLGQSVTSLVALPDRYPDISPLGITGQVVHIDRFGNLITNISSSSVSRWMKVNQYREIEVTAGEWQEVGVQRTYADVEKGTPLALFGSMGYLEIATNGGSASETLRMDYGAEIQIIPADL